MLYAMLRDERGATMTEYAIILSLLSLAMTVLFVAIATSLNGQYGSMTSNMQTYQTGALVP